MLIGLELLRKNIDKVRMIQEKWKTSISKQKSHADERRRPLNFIVAGNNFS